MKKIIDITAIHKLELEILKEIDRLCKENGITYYLLAGSILGAIRHKGFIPWDEDGDIIIPIKQYSKFRSVFEKKLDKKYRLLTCDDSSFPEYFMRVVLRNQDPMCAYIDVYFLIGAPGSIKEQEQMLKKQNKIMKKKYMRFINVFEGKNWLKRIARLLGKIKYNLVPLSVLNREYFKFAFKYDFDTSDNVHCSYGRYGMKNFFKKSVFEYAIYVDFEDIKLPIPNGYEEILFQFYGDYHKYPSDDIIKTGLAYTSVYWEEGETDD